MENNTTVLVNQSQTVSWSSTIHNQSNLRFIICGWVNWTFPAAWHHRTESGPDERPSSPLCTELGQSPCTLIGAVCVPSLQKGSCRLQGRVQICVATLASTLPAGSPPTRTWSPPAEGAQRECGVTALSNRRHELSGCVR